MFLNLIPLFFDEGDAGGSGNGGNGGQDGDGGKGGGDTGAGGTGDKGAGSGESGSTSKLTVDQLKAMSTEELVNITVNALEQKRNANEGEKSLRLKLEKFNTEKEKVDTEKLKEQNKYKELYEQEVTKREGVEGALKTLKIGHTLQFEAIKQGIIDPDTVKLIDQKSIILSEDGEPTNVPKVVGALKKDKPFLFSDKKSEPPAPSGPFQPGVGNVGGTKTDAGIQPARRASGLTAELAENMKKGRTG